MPRRGFCFLSGFLVLGCCWRTNAGDAGRTVAGAVARWTRTIVERGDEIIKGMDAPEYHELSRRPGRRCPAASAQPPP